MSAYLLYRSKKSKSLLPFFFLFIFISFFRLKDTKISLQQNPMFLFSYNGYSNSTSAGHWAIANTESWESFRNLPGHWTCKSSEWFLRNYLPCKITAQPILKAREQSIMSKHTAKGKFYLLQTCRSFYKYMKNLLMMTVYILELVKDMWRYKDLEFCFAFSIYS